MLDRATQQKILTTTRRLWSTKVSSQQDLTRLIRSGAGGRSLASSVERQTIQALQKAFSGRVAFEQTKKGKRSTSSMGDIWIKAGGIYNPVNIKTGVKQPGGTGGSPNIVSLRKLTDAVFRRSIDAYYLLRVQFIAGPTPKVDVRLVDLLQIMESYVRFDSGHGQLMLMAKEFDEDRPSPKYGVIDAKRALEHLQERRKIGDERLTANRRRARTEATKAMDGFDGSAPIDQTDARLKAP